MNPDTGTHIQVYTAADAEFYTTSRFASTPHNDRAVNLDQSNPILACTTRSAWRCAKTSVSREAAFAPDL